MTSETARYQQRKRELIGRLRGRVLEVGAGRGANFAHLHPGSEWVGLEPDARRHRALASRAEAHGHRIPPIAAPLEAIPLPGASVSAVLATVVLCSVRSQERALDEVARVLEPGGSFVFAEHVVAPPRSVRRALQRAVCPFSKAFDSGCDPTRDTAQALDDSTLEVRELTRFELPVLAGLRLPYIVGRAIRPA